MEEKIRLDHEPCFSNQYLDMTPKSHKKREIENLNFIKIKNTYQKTQESEKTVQKGQSICKLYKMWFLYVCVDEW